MADEIENAFEVDEDGYVIMDYSGSSYDEGQSDDGSEDSCSAKSVFGEKSLSLKNLETVRRTEIRVGNSGEINYSSGSGSEDNEENHERRNPGAEQNQVYQPPVRWVADGVGDPDDLEAILYTLPAGKIIELPVLENNFLVYMPGSIINETYVRACEVLIMNSLMETTKMFGYTRNASKSEVGVTCMLFHLHPGNPDGEIPTGGYMCTIKAKSMQRFKILSWYWHDDQIRRVKAMILPEIILPDPFQEVRLISRDRLRPIRVEGGNRERTRTGKKKRYKFSKFNHLRTPVYGPPIMPFPNWVYEMYNPQVLVERVRRKLMRFKLFSMAQRSIPHDPFHLPFWVATYFPMDVSQKLALLKVNCVIQRLRMVIRLLARIRTLCCSRCGITIGRTSHMFSTSREIPQGISLKLDGYVTDTITVFSATNAKVSHLAESDLSEYPGYTLKMQCCQRCTHMVGWSFSAKPDNNDGFLPREFYALSSDGMQPTIIVADTEEEGWFRHRVI